MMWPESSGPSAEVVETYIKGLSEEQNVWDEYILKGI